MWSKFLFGCIWREDWILWLTIFMSLSLVRYLLSMQMTIVGTVSENKRFLVPEFQSSRGK